MAGTPATLGRLTLALLASFALFATAASGAAAQDAAAATGAGVSAVPAGAEDPSSVEDFWTPERIEEAAPLDEEVTATGLPEPLPTPEAPSAALDPVPFSTVATSGPPQLLRAPHGRILRDPTIYPNRVHGKLVGSFEGVGSFGCSATVVSSGSGSLLVSAGHCAYDPLGAGFASKLAFAPGYSRDSTPYGVWPITNVIVPRGWAQGALLDYDVSFMRVALKEGVPIQEAVGARGIAFDQPRRQPMKAYGYPATGSPRYNGMKLVRCNSGYVPDPA